MFNINYLIVTIVVSVFWFSSCSTNNNIIPRLNYNYEYYPLQVGKYVIYDVTDTIYQFSKPPAPSKYQLKYLIADTFNTLNNQKAFKLDIYKRNLSSEPWVIDSVWNVQLENINELVLTQSNVKRVKLKFPIKENERWNVNKYNSNNEFNHQYKNVFKSYLINNINYDKTVKVVFENDTKGVTVYNDVYEIYAAEIGLIKLFIEKYEYDQSSSTRKILTGVYRSMQVASYGKE